MSDLEPRRTPVNGHPIDGRPVDGGVPGLARVVAMSSVRVGAWAAMTGLNASRRAVDVVLHPEHAPELAEDLRAAAAAITRALVGEDTDGRVRSVAGVNPVVRVVADAVEAVT